MKLLVAAVLAALPCHAGAAQAKVIVRCIAAGQGDVVITLHHSRGFGRVLDCISGPFVVDLTPCAPDRGFGLSAGTGAAELVGIATRWQDARLHPAGIVGHFDDTEMLRFDAYLGGLGDEQKLWSFHANRLTGDAVLQRPDKPDVAYRCARARQRF